MPLKGRKMSSEHKHKISIANKGRVFSDESRKKMSRAKKGITPWNKGKKGVQKASEETRKKMSASRLGIKRPDYVVEKVRKALTGVPRPERRGENHHFWKGGITNEHMRIRNSLEYKKWREAVFSRDNWTCINCSARSSHGIRVYLEADHIKPFYLFPEKRLDVDNGRTLCKKCHKLIGYNYFKENNPRKTYFRVKAKK